MLRKLMKYDMRAISKSVSPLFAASGIVSIVCCVMLYFTYGFSEEAESIFSALAVTGSFYIIGIMTIAALWAVTAFIGISRYYKSLFTDEGYLNMVLPVKTSVLFGAKLLSTFIWVLLATITTGVCAFVAVYLPTVLHDPEMISTAAEDMRWLLGFGDGVVGLAFAARIIELIGGAFSFVCNIFVIVTAITLGSVAMRKHRLMGCIMFCFLINLAVEIVTSFASFIIGIAFGEESLVAADFASAVFGIVLYIAVCVSAYFVNVYVLSKKFNIE